jgi:hypothetical protein
MKVNEILQGYTNPSPEWLEDDDVVDIIDESCLTPAPAGGWTEEEKGWIIASSRGLRSTSPMLHKEWKKLPPEKKRYFLYNLEECREWGMRTMKWKGIVYGFFGGLFGMAAIQKLMKD